MRSCILVTGGAGFIGSHTCVALSASGYAPLILDN
ncbi:NAD-dependent epimerase/dehydratase family protein, partial [Mycobacterium tuberculosis]